MDTGLIEVEKYTIDTLNYFHFRISQFDLNSHFTVQSTSFELRIQKGCQKIKRHFNDHIGN